MTTILDISTFKLYTMGLFRRKSKKEKLEQQYEKKLEEAYKMSHINRAKSDQLRSEAEDILKMIEEEEKASA